MSKNELHKAIITEWGTAVLGLPSDTIVYFSEWDWTKQFQPPEDWYAIALNVKFADGTPVGDRVNISLQVDNPATCNWLLVQ